MNDIQLELVMRDDGKESNPKLNIRDSVVMGDINIHASKPSEEDSSSCVELNLPLGEGLRSFIKYSWLSLISKHSTEKIPLEIHRKVFCEIYDHVYSSNVEEDLIQTYRDIIRCFSLDDRSLMSTTIQSELGLLNALTYYKLNDFEEFVNLITNSFNRLGTEFSHEEQNIGIFELLSNFYYVGDDLDEQDLIVEVCADSITQVVSNNGFMIKHGDWLISRLLANHNHPSTHRSTFGKLWSSIRLDRHDTVDFVFEKILKDNTLTLIQFEQIIRIVFHPDMKMYPPDRGKIMDFSEERFNIVTYSIRLATLKCSELLRVVTKTKDVEKFNEFWAWLDLITFVSTFHSKSLPIGKKDEILPDIERLFSDLEEAKRGGGVLYHPRLEMKIVRILNSLNAVYYPDALGYVTWNLQTKFMSGLFDHTRHLAHGPVPRRKRVNIDDFPVYWTGSDTVPEQHPKFDDFFTEWLNGKSLQNFVFWSSI
jgi:hypothetical protein